MRAWAAWQRYWFRPAPLVDLAVVRLIAVGFQLSHLAALSPRALFADLAALPDFMYAPLVVLRVMALPFGWHYRPAEDLMMGIYWATLVFGVLAFVGYRTTLSLLVFAVGNLFMQAYLYSFHEIHHPEAIVMLTLVVIALAPAGAVLSVDDLGRQLRQASRERRVPRDPLARESPLARWPLLVVRWLFALIYLSAAFHKLASSGLDWMNGWTLQFYMLQDAMRWGTNVAGTGAGYADEPGVGAWIGQHHSIALVGSWLSILFESTFWLVLFFPRLALIYLPIGTAFHLSVYVIQRVSFFSFICLYAVFVPWSVVLRRIGAWLANHSVRPIVHYDPASARSVRLATVIRCFDVFGICELSPRTAPTEGVVTAQVP